MRALSFVVLPCVIAAGCQTPTLPTGSWRRGTPAAAAEPPAIPTLEIRNASAIARVVANGDDKVSYILRFDIAETGGARGAVIDRIETWILDKRSDVVDSDCWGTWSMRVGAGGTLRVDETLGYCAPLASSHEAVADVTVEVWYSDGLNAGRIRAVAPVTR